MTNKETLREEIASDWAEFNGEMEIVTPDESAVVCNWWLSKLEQIRNEDKKISKIEWEDSKDELYTYFGKCECGETSVMVDSKYCCNCGKIIANPLRSS